MKNMTSEMKSSVHGHRSMHPILTTRLPGTPLSSYFISLALNSKSREDGSGCPTPGHVSVSRLRGGWENEHPTFETSMEKLEIASRKSEMPREYFMQR